MSVALQKVMKKNSQTRAFANTELAVPDSSEIAPKDKPTSDSKPD